MTESAIGRTAALPRRVYGTHLPPEAYAGRHRADQNSPWDAPTLENVLARLHAWDPTHATT